MARMTRPDFSLSATAIISNKAAGTICHEAPEFVLQPAALLRPFIAALSSARVFFDVRLQPRQSVVPLL
jgi:hypothetical protein